MSSSLSQITPHERKTSNHAVIILASGLSQRLGQAKQLLRKEGEPLMCSMLKLALTTKPQAIVVVIHDNNPVIVKAIIDLACQYPSIRTVKNPQPETGMAHSLFLGIEALSDLSLSVERILIMGIDQVLLGEPHLTKLLAGEQPVVASGYQSWTHSDDMTLNDSSTANPSERDIVGLPLVIDRALLKQWQSTLAGDKGLRHLIRALSPSQIGRVTNRQLSYDIDTPEQLAYAQQKGWLDKQL